MKFFTIAFLLFFVTFMKAEKINIADDQHGEDPPLNKQNWRDTSRDPEYQGPKNNLQIDPSSCDKIATKFCEGYYMKWLCHKSQMALCEAKRLKEEIAKKLMILKKELAKHTRNKREVEKEIARDVTEEDNAKEVEGEHKDGLGKGEDGKSIFKAREEDIIKGKKCSNSRCRKFNKRPPQKGRNKMNRKKKCNRCKKQGDGKSME